MGDHESKVRVPREMKKSDKKIGANKDGDENVWKRYIDDNECICLTMNRFVHSQKQFVSNYKCSTSQDEMFCGADN